VELLPVWCIFPDLTLDVHVSGVHVRIPARPFVAPASARKVVLTIGRMGARTDLNVVLRLRPNSQEKVNLLRQHLALKWTDRFTAALEVGGKSACLAPCLTMCW
jgi:hypothetical protein